MWFTKMVTMNSAELQNLKNQVPVLIGNLKNKGDFGFLKSFNSCD